MILFIAFVMFAALMACWLVLPEKSEASAVKPVEKAAPETRAMPARA